MASSEVFFKRYKSDPAIVGTLSQAWDAARKFSLQGHAARQRGIEWELTFEEWWCIWQKSGVWHLRGRSSAESMVMARYEDKGPYAVGNVRIITVSKNMKEAWKVNPEPMRRNLKRGKGITAPPKKPH